MISINIERFETSGLSQDYQPSCAAPKDGSSFNNYSRLFSSVDGEFLCKIRDIYGMRPSNDSLIGPWPHGVKGIRR